MDKDETGKIGNGGGEGIPDEVMQAEILRRRDLILANAPKEMIAMTLMMEAMAMHFELVLPGLESRALGVFLQGRNKLTRRMGAAVASNIHHGRDGAEDDDGEADSLVMCN